MTEEPTEIIAGVSMSRKFFGVFSLSVPMLMVGALVIQGAFQTPLALAVGFVLVAVFGWAAWRMWSAPNFGIVYDGKALRTEDGIELARLDEIENVQTGLFALRPSNGFLLVLKERGQRPTRPGVFWQQGRSLGIGGILHSEPAKSIGKAIQIELDRRN